MGKIKKIIYPVKKKIIISFSVPRRRRINKLWVALLDEGILKQQEIPHKTDMYVYLKKEQNQKKMADFSASDVDGCCQNPKVNDSIIHVYCEMSVIMLSACALTAKSTAAVVNSQESRLAFY